MRPIDAVHADPRLTEALFAEAPRVRVRVTNIVPELSTVLALEPPSMALVPSRFLNDDIRSLSLPELEFGVLGRKGHPAFRRGLTTEHWLAHPHVVVRIGNEPTNLIEDELRRRGLERHIGLEVPSFLAGLLVVSQSNLLMNAPMPLVNDAARSLGLRLVPAPLPLPRVRFALAWHPRFDRDPAQRWARARIFAEVRSALTSRRTQGAAC